MQISGIDFAGDSTVFYGSCANWLAGRRKSADVHLNDFLSAMYIFTKDVVCKYWSSEILCRQYLLRLPADLRTADLANEFRHYEKRKSRRGIHIVWSGWSIRVGRPGDLVNPPQIDAVLQELLDEVHSYASESNLEYIRPELVLLILASNPRYGEKERILGHGIDIAALTEAAAR